MITDGPWWSLLIIHDPWWSQLTIEDHWRLLMNIDGHWWLSIIIDDHWWSLMITDDHWWSLMIIYWHGWSLMIIDQNGMLAVRCNHGKGQHPILMGCWRPQHPTLTPGMENLIFSYFFVNLEPKGLFHDVGEVEYYLYTNSQVASSKPRWFSTIFPTSIEKSSYS